MLILIAGPVRSGTKGDPVLIHANMRKLDEAALQVYHKGHTPVIGEWLALPLAAVAGSQAIGDEISEAYLYPVAHRLIQHCDAILRMPSASHGADNDIRIGRELGLKIYTNIDEIPSG
ncbi:MAG: NUDIX hydrolase [Pantoea sp. Pent]|nr:NUDIX hydrolase [Pantoea sp. Pent]